jgi:hypothetical protein
MIGRIVSQQLSDGATGRIRTPNPDPHSRTHTSSGEVLLFQSPTGGNNLAQGLSDDSVD